MVNNDSSSPARRPQNGERSASSQSLSRGSPSTAPLTKAQKGSSHKLHKAHAVGSSRQPHGRNPSYGKGLNRLSRLGPGSNTEGSQVKTHVRSASHSPTTSPISPGFKRNSSTISLPRHGSSKALAKKNHSHLTLARNGSTTKMGTQTKAEKARLKEHLRKKGTNDAPLKGIASFEVGEEAQDDEWTEDSTSPYTTRQNSANPSRPKTPISRDPPSPDDSTEGFLNGRTLKNLPESPPESPHQGVSEVDLRSAKRGPEGSGARKSSHYSHPPDAEAVTHRLLNRNGSHHRVSTPQTSTVSANSTPPAMSTSPGTTPATREPSMPADGISRFLDRTGSDSAGGTPSSISQLQSTLAHLPQQNGQTKGKAKADSRRVKSAANLAHSPLVSLTSEDASTATSTTVNIEQAPSTAQAHIQKPAPSPWESARGQDASGGRSLTQLKLDLERRQVEEAGETPTPLIKSLPHHSYGGLLDLAGLGGDDKQMTARMTRQWETARQELEGVKRYWPDIVTKNIVGKERIRRAKTGETVHRSKTTTAGTTPVGSVDPARHRDKGKSRVRFEVGRNSFDDHTDGAVNGNGTDGGMVAPDGERIMPGAVNEVLNGLLSRMWHSGEINGEE